MSIPTLETVTEQMSVPVTTTAIEVVGLVSPTQLVRSLLTQPDVAAHVYALLGIGLNMPTEPVPPVKVTPKAEFFVSQADRDEAMIARRTEGSNERARLLMGLAVRALRINARMKRTVLSETSGVSYPFLCEIEKGSKNMSVDTLDKIAAALGTTANEIRAFADSL